MAIHGRDPATGRALRKDGKPRKKRRTLSMQEQLQKLAEQQRTARVTIGRKVFKSLDSMSDFLSGIGTFRRWIREARSYGTPEKRAERAEYFQRMLDMVEAKGNAAEAFLEDAKQAESVISNLYANIGKDIEEYTKEHGAPDSDTYEAIVARHLTSDIQALVESANDPDSDPFAEFRRGADSDDEDTEDEDNLED